MRGAAATPAKAPTSCATNIPVLHANPPCEASASATAGLKFAPETGPKVRMSATSTAPVASVLASNAMPALPTARRSPIMPEPTTAASNDPVPNASAAMRPTVSYAAARGPATRGLRSTNEGAHEFALHLWSNRLHIHALPHQKGTRILDVVHAGRSDFDVGKTSFHEFAEVLIVRKRPRNAAGP